VISSKKAQSFQKKVVESKKHKSAFNKKFDLFCFPKNMSENNNNSNFYKLLGIGAATLAVLGLTYFVIAKDKKKHGHDKKFGHLAPVNPEKDRLINALKKANTNAEIEEAAVFAHASVTTDARIYVGFLTSETRDLIIHLLRNKCSNAASSAAVLQLVNPLVVNAEVQKITLNQALFDTVVATAEKYKDDGSIMHHFGQFAYICYSTPNSAFTAVLVNSEKVRNLLIEAIPITVTTNRRAAGTLSMLLSFSVANIADLLEKGEVSVREIGRKVCVPETRDAFVSYLEVAPAIAGSVEDEDPLLYTIEGLLAVCRIGNFFGAEAAKAQNLDMNPEKLPEDVKANTLNICADDRFGRALSSAMKKLTASWAALPAELRIATDANEIRRCFSLLRIIQLAASSSLGSEAATKDRFANPDFIDSLMFALKEHEKMFASSDAFSFLQLFFNVYGPNPYSLSTGPVKFVKAIIARDNGVELIDRLCDVTKKLTDSSACLTFVNLLGKLTFDGKYRPVLERLFENKKFLPSLTHCFNVLDKELTSEGDAQLQTVVNTIMVTLYVMGTCICRPYGLRQHSLHFLTLKSPEFIKLQVDELVTNEQNRVDWDLVNKIKKEFASRDDLFEVLFKLHNNPKIPDDMCFFIPFVFTELCNNNAEMQSYFYLDEINKKGYGSKIRNMFKIDLKRAIALRKKSAADKNFTTAQIVTPSEIVVYCMEQIYDSLRFYSESDNFSCDHNIREEPTPASLSTTPALADANVIEAIFDEDLIDIILTVTDEDAKQVVWNDDLVESYLNLIKVALCGKSEKVNAIFKTENRLKRLEKFVDEHCRKLATGKMQEGEKTF
jgi:hypothetical protein